MLKQMKKWLEGRKITETETEMKEEAWIETKEVTKAAMRERRAVRLARISAERAEDWVNAIEAMEALESPEGSADMAEAKRAVAEAEAAWRTAWDAAWNAMEEVVKK